jgi:hypothetical protein
MSAFAKPLHDGHLTKNTVHRREGGRAFLDGVIDKMAQLHGERGARLFAFAAPHWRAGTTHVVHLVAEELARRYRCTVGVLPAEVLKDSHPAQLTPEFEECSPGVYVATANREHGPNYSFDFTLFDCPALLKGAQALQWTNAADGVFLVVAAGLTHVNQIEESQRLLKMSASRLEGLVLNRRSYPIPKALYKLL